MDIAITNVLSNLNKFISFQFTKTNVEYGDREVNYMWKIYGWLHLQFQSTDENIIEKMVILLKDENNVIFLIGFICNGNPSCNYNEIIKTELVDIIERYVEKQHIKRLHYNNPHFKQIIVGQKIKNSLIKNGFDKNNKNNFIENKANKHAKILINYLQCSMGIFNKKWKCREIVLKRISAIHQQFKMSNGIFKFAHSRKQWYEFTTSKQLAEYRNKKYNCSANDTINFIVNMISSDLIGFHGYDKKVYEIIMCHVEIMDDEICKTFKKSVICTSFIEQYLNKKSSKKRKFPTTCNTKTVMPIAIQPNTDVSIKTVFENEEFYVDENTNDFDGFDNLPFNDDEFIENEEIKKIIDGFIE